MSVLGTSIAAGVAQTTLAAQQTARRQDREASRVRDDARRVRERFESRLQSLEEGDDDQAIDRVQIDSQVPQHGGTHPDGRRPSGHAAGAGMSGQVPPLPVESGDDATTAYTEAAKASAVAAEEGQALYRHLDVEA